MIRVAKESDIEDWSKMRTQLWPDTKDKHVSEIRKYFSGQSIDIVQVYVVEIDSVVAGFIELNIRNFVEGSREPSVPYIEAWYTSPEYQGMGYGRQLMTQAEQWAASKGYSEIASDAEINNAKSISMHQHLGFHETERVVCFLKRINQA